MRWPLRRARTPQPAGEASGPASAAPPAARAAGTSRAARDWAALPALRPSVLPPPAIAVAADGLPDVSGTRSLLHRTTASLDEPALTGRVEGLAAPLAPAQAQRPAARRRALRLPRPPASAELPAGEPLPQPAARPMRALNHPRSLQQAPLTQAVEAWVGQPQEPAEPYRAPGWLRAAGNAPFFTPGDQPAPPEPPAPSELLQGMTSWTAPWPLPSDEEAAPAPPAASTAAAAPLLPSPSRRRNLGQSRRLGLGAPLTQPPGEAPLTHPAEGQHSDVDDDADEEPAPGLPPPAPAPSHELPPPAAAAPQLPPLAAPFAPAAGREAPAALRHPPAAREAAAPAPVVRYQSGPAPAQPQPHAQVVLPPADPPGVERVPPAVAATFQATYHTDISRVPVFRGPEAATEARSRNTRAFSRGGAVYLPADEGPLDGPRARPLLGHELVHVVQQRTLGSALPHPHSPHGRALEAQARAAEGMVSAGGAAAAGAAELTHSPALDPSRYVTKLAEELLRQGLAHRDGAGHVVLGSAGALDFADSSAVITQHYFEEEDLLKVKLQVLSDLGKSTYTRLEDLRDNYTIAMHEAELEAWKSATKEELTSDKWLLDKRVEAMNAAAVRHRTDAKVFTDQDISGTGRDELDQARQKFNALEGESSGSSLPRIPKIIGLTWDEAKLELRSVAKTKKIVKHFRESSSAKGIVIAVTPDEGKTCLSVDQVTVVVSSGRTRRGAAGEAATSALQTATSMLGLRWKDSYAEGVRVYSAPEEEEEQESTAAQTGEKTPTPKTGGKTPPAGRTPGASGKGTKQQPATSSGASPTGGPSTPAAKPAASTPTPLAPLSSADAPVTQDGADTAAEDFTPAAVARPTAAASKKPKEPDAERALRMPQVVGLTLDEAKIALSGARITKYNITYRSSTKAKKDIVIQASHGEKAYLGTEKNPKIPDIIVSSGHSYGALAAEAGIELAGTLDALTGTKFFRKKQEEIRQTFRVSEERKEKIGGSAQQESGTEDVDDLLPGTEQTAPDTSAITEAAKAAVTTTASSTVRAGKRQIPADDLDLDELADRLYSRLRSRLAMELRNDRARAGMLSDYR
ncbi:DUF4157 domain-containing protein [Streptomyces sp. NPDC126514]|uniref:eCIS core domain-containing protein n=1 Tax=Streptomyces sp. NPDC126514 TaxID=3155210 RepID=UPI0033345611